MTSTSTMARKTRLSKRATGYLYMAPSMLWLIVFIVYPLIFALVMAFKHFVLKRGVGFFAMPWAGFGNFAAAFHSAFFLQSCGRTGLMLVIAVTIEFLIGLALANLLSKKDIRVQSLWVMLIMTPMMLPLIASGNLWRMLFDPRWGAVNAFLLWFGIKPVDFLGSPHWSFFTVIVVDIWQWTPFIIIILLAGFRSVPQEPREAAFVDGASRFQIFTQVTLPLMRTQIIIVLLIRGMDVVKTFDFVYALTFGGPGQSSTVVTFYIYLQAFTEFRLGYGSALSWLVFIVVYLITMVVLRATRRGGTDL